MSKFRDFEKYEVYSDGRIYSYKSKKFLKHYTNKNGYKRVALTDNEGKKKWYFLHRVVWESVTGEQIPKGFEINHRSEVKTENFFANLELMSHKQNINYGSRNERSAKSQSKQVGAFNRNGELVIAFQSTMEAERETGIKQQSISACCNNKQKFAGKHPVTGEKLHWRYL